MRLLAFLFLFLVGMAPARADDISAAGRGVVRVVTIAVVNDEVVGFGHGSGFAVAPNRVVTNAHVVEIAQRYPGNVIVGVVPSEGDKSYQAKLVALDQSRDLALIELQQGVRLPPLTLYTGPSNEGDAMVALGYPGNVDLATAKSASDFITPLSPVRSQGVFSGRRSLAGTQVLLHTASIARGNSGGPLLDRCGRVLGVNSALTRSDEGDASFGFAIADTEVMSFLRAAKQPFASVGNPCISIEDRLAQDRNADEADREANALRTRDAAARAATARAQALEEARERNAVARENYMGIAALMLVLGGLIVGGGGFLVLRDRRREAIWSAAGGATLMVAAIVVFVMRPAFNAASVNNSLTLPVPEAAGERGGIGRMICRFVPERSRVTVSATTDVALDVAENGCVNGRTQYAESGDNWQRILVPDEEQEVSVLEYAPATRTYTNTRYLLSAAQMRDARKLRADVKTKQCSTDPARRADLASKQQAVKTALPQLFNERLVYRCSPVTP